MLTQNLERAIISHFQEKTMHAILKTGRKYILLILTHPKLSENHKIHVVGPKVIAVRRDANMLL